jgi:RNA polymerase sigma factor (sigma-70 family)
MNTDLPESEATSRAGAFAVTRWSVVLAAADQQCPESDAALELLCGTYWYPLYAFARRMGRSPDDAAELTQEFFVRLLEQDFLNKADPERGKFRSFLLTVFKRFLLNEHDRDQAQKRGGGTRRFFIDASVGEHRYAFEPADDWTPEAVFERRWALTVLDQVMQRLEQAFHERNKPELFDLCRPHLVGGEQSTSYAEIAVQLKMSEAAVRVAVHRMRVLYRELLAAEIAGTIDEDESIVEEMNCLRAAIRGKTPNRRVTNRDEF